MEELLQRLEKKIKDVLDLYQQKGQSVQQLNHEQDVIIREKDSLVARQHKAAMQIEALLTKLKTIEKLA